MVDSYEVVWERDTSGECPNKDEGSATITDGSTSYIITGLEEDSSYIITVTATNAIGSAVTNPMTGMTGEAGERQCYIPLLIRYFCLFQLSLPHPLLLVHLM